LTALPFPSVADHATIAQTVRHSPLGDTLGAACFQQALAIVRRHRAKAWELHAAASLARLWQHQGKRIGACALSVPI